jgi:hypothetical protein
MRRGIPRHLRPRRKCNPIYKVIVADPMHRSWNLTIVPDAFDIGEFANISRNTGSNIRLESISVSRPERYSDEALVTPPGAGPASPRSLSASRSRTG